MRLITSFAIAAFLAGPAVAQVYIPAPQQCSSQMIARVTDGMPTRTDHLDPRLLTCGGLAEVFFIQTDPEVSGQGEARRMIEAVFRREGLIR